MTTTDVIMLAFDLLETHGLTPNWSFALDNAKRRFGACCFNTRRISMSRLLLANASETAIRNTLLHEIAHALGGRESWT